MTRFFFRIGRRKIAYFVVPLLVISGIFICYQILLFYRFLSTQPQLQKDTLSAAPLVRGIHTLENTFYAPRDGKFTCIKSMEIIGASKVNDNYCDCLDGTDEPGTNACPNGVFYCATASKDIRHPKSIPSPRVNDGICDCCDGSDEFLQNSVIKGFERYLQEETGHYLVPCPNKCS